MQHQHREPTLVRRQLGRKLKTLREAAGKTPEDVQTIAGRSKLWRIETGKISIRPADARELGRMYGADEATVQALGRLAEGTKGRGWWEGSGDSIPEGMELFVGLEAGADETEAFHPDAVIGLLQTADYARAVERGTGGRTDEEVERIVRIRLGRQAAVLRRPRPGRVRAVLGAGALLRQVGGPDVMAEQIGHLKRLAGEPHIDIRVLPWEIGAHEAMLGQFRILNFQDPDDPPIVFLESYVGKTYVESEPEVRNQRSVFAGIYKKSVPIEEYTP